MPGLRHSNTVEKALNEHYAPICVLRRPNQVIEHLAFLESRRQLILRLGFVDGTAGVGYQFPGCVLDGDHDSPAHTALPGKESHAEVLGCLWINPALG